jgi:tetratricopeptide (TPR) repeat protein
MTTRFPADVLTALQGGRAAVAEQLCRKRLTILPRDPSARALLPVALLHQGRHGEAVPLLETLAREQPDEVSHAVNLGLALGAIGRIDDAVTRLQQASRRWPQDAAVHATLGHTLLQRGFARAAVKELETALALQPRDAHSAALLARALIETGGQQERAAGLVDAILASSSRDPTTLTELGIALVGLQRDDEAEQCLQQSLAIDPAHDAARMHLAHLHERQNRVTAALTQLEAVSDAGRADPLWQLAHGRLLRRRVRHAEAVAALEALLGHVPDGPIAAEAATELGKARHALGQYEAAYAAFERGNRLMLAIESEQRGAASPSEDPGQWLLRAYTADEAARWSPPAAPADRTPIFVVGFPRSGTTLLENMLDAHPGLQALEEKPAIDAILAELERRGNVDSGLAMLDGPTVEELRATYWREVGRHLELRPGARLVDRYPLNMARLAVIARVFPGAPVVLALRHPCDVVLSCFMQNFRIRDGTVGFHTLLNGARIYDRLMRKWCTEIATFAPPLLTLRYEDLVMDVRNSVERLADFLQVAWDERLLDHASHALSRGRIHTPSYAQVVEPVYTSAVARWRHYERYFGPALEVLAPWIHYWGYDETRA